MSDSLSVQQKALLAIKRLQERVVELEQREHEPIAVLGIGCRFPTAATGYEEFARLLEEGGDVVDDLPADRYEALGNEPAQEGQRIASACVIAGALRQYGIQWLQWRLARERLDPQSQWRAIRGAKPLRGDLRTGARLDNEPIPGSPIEPISRPRNAVTALAWYDQDFRRRLAL